MGVTTDVEGGEDERRELPVAWLSYIKPMGQCLKVSIIFLRLDLSVVFIPWALTTSAKSPLRFQTTNLLP